MSLEAMSEPGGVPPESLRRIDEVLMRYGLQRLGQPSPVPDSVLSENYRVETSAGPRFVRMHKKTRTLERIEAEYDLLRWAGAHRIPVVPPLADETGRVIHRLGGAFVSIFPWIEGRTLDPAMATPDDARRLGAVHGEVTAVLAGYENNWIRESRPFPRWDTQASIDVLGRVDDLIRYYPAPPAEQLALQERIRLQLALLEAEGRPISDFDALRRQVCFGDFHERQVIFRDDRTVAAVVDWEGLCWAAPAWEVVRSLTVSGMLPAERLEAYLDGYASRAPLAPGEAELAVEAHWQFILHDTWSLATRFIQGDRRPERFFASEATSLRLFADPGYRAWLAGELRGASG